MGLGHCSSNNQPTMSVVLYKKHNYHGEVVGKKRRRLLPVLILTITAVILLVDGNGGSLAPLTENLLSLSAVCLVVVDGLGLN